VTSMKPSKEAALVSGLGGPSPVAYSAAVARNTPNVPGQIFIRRRVESGRGALVLASFGVKPKGSNTLCPSSSPGAGGQ
jgi:hypothetical protein